ncbi:SurA N-terminal domain-containing protein [Nitrosomonas sp. Is37]|uniref:SurA N-terminal domain-containing protein n=1 Tax=Nitrosomonas sp. Is37 TaxID=3080535 RepID=UPI00294AF969|nr:SurA N-terminal domain-containing protein [Nitrosomonas sp. Is37]MDV6344976.1 SurA N-terminal domain-containing protein [Nitrosomonas sp. Is37]
MFDFVHQKKIIVQVILLLAVLPFMFWGVQSYRTDGQESYVAVVEGEEIPRREFEQALRNQHETMRNMLGDKFDSTMFDNPQMRLAVLESLIQKKLLKREAANVGLTVLDSQLAREIQNISAFHEDQKFSYQRYEELLRRQEMTPAMFELRVVAEIMQQQLLEAITRSAMIPDIVTRNVAHLSEVKREINQVKIEPQHFVSQITPDEAAIQSYYDNHQADFLLPERVRIEYLVLSLEELTQQEEVTADEIRNYFDEHQSEFGQEEQRKASHILITVPATASDDEKATARDKAENLLAQLKVEPEKFAELASENSEDQGSAKVGGDLGFLGRGILVKEFEDELFQMQPNEIRGPVETAFGFHIIRLSEIKPAKIASLEEVRDDIEQILKRQKAASSFGKIAEDFSNIVYEQSDSLQSAAEKFGLPIKQSGWIDKKSKEPAIVTNEKLLQAIFSDDVINDKRNTEAIEVMSDTLVSARVLEHKSAAIQSLDVVRDEIIDRVKKQLAAELAEQEGRAKLAQLQAGEDALVSWDDAKEVSYMRPQGMEIDTLRTIFQTEIGKLPAYTGITGSDGSFNLIRINRVIEPVSLDKAQYQVFSNQLKQMIVQEELSSYQLGLRQRYDVKIREESY